MVLTRIQSDARRAHACAAALGLAIFSVSACNVSADVGGVPERSESSDLSGDGISTISIATTSVGQADTNDDASAADVTGPDADSGTPSTTSTDGDPTEGGDGSEDPTGATESGSADDGTSSESEDSTTSETDDDSETTGEDPRCPPPISFPDPELDAYVRTVVGIGPDDPFDPADLAAVKTMFLREFEITDLEGIVCLPNLEVLLVSMSGGSLDPLVELEALDSLFLLVPRDADAPDTQALPRIPALTGILIDNVGDLDLGAIAGIEGLSILELIGTNIESVQSLSQATELTQFGISKTELADIEFLRSLSRIEVLDISNNQIESLDALSGIDQLKRLRAGGNQIASATVLERFPALTLLDLSDNPGIELPDLSSFGVVEELDVSETGLTELDQLATLGALRELQVVGNGIRDLSPLANSTGLEELSADGNAIVDLSPLNRLRELTLLSVNDNSIADLSPLLAIPDIERLNVRGNQITQLDPLLELRSLTQLDIRGNPFDCDEQRDALTMLAARVPIFFSDCE